MHKEPPIFVFGFFCFVFYVDGVTSYFYTMDCNHKQNAKN